MARNTKKAKPADPATDAAPDAPAAAPSASPSRSAREEMEDGARASSGRDAARSSTRQPAKGLKVRAIRQGFYNNIRRREGDVFILHDERFFSRKWMERVSGGTPERVTGPQQALDREHGRLSAGNDETPEQREQRDEAERRARNSGEVPGGDGSNVI